MEDGKESVSVLTPVVSFSVLCSRIEPMHDIDARVMVQKVLFY